MNAEKQRIAIAEACGWRRHEIGGITRFNPWIHKDADGEDYKNWKTDTQLPDYLHDLDDMFDAEETLIEAGLTQAYYDQLVAVTTVDRFFLIHASPKARAEAFLRTIGRWESDT